MREISPMYEDIQLEEIKTVVRTEDYPALTHHFVAWLAAKKDDASKHALEQLISDLDYDKPIRADAFAALYGLDPQRAIKAYESISGNRSLAELTEEFERVTQQAALQALAPNSDEAKARLAELPSLDDTKAWLDRIEGKGMPMQVGGFGYVLSASNVTHGKAAERPLVQNCHRLQKGRRRNNS